LSCCDVNGCASRFDLIATRDEPRLLSRRVNGRDADIQHKLLDRCWIFLQLCELECFAKILSERERFT
jgi:hypothetical protein